MVSKKQVHWFSKTKAICKDLNKGQVAKINSTTQKDKHDLEIQNIDKNHMRIYINRRSYSECFF